MTAEQVRPIVKNSFKAIQQMAEGSNAEILMMSDRFSWDLRDYVQRRITGMKSGVGNVQKAKVIMREA